MSKINKTYSRTNKVLLFSLIFIFGFIAGYMVITYTNIFPINYVTKFNQIYNKEKLGDFEERYVDMGNGFVFDYPSNYKVDPGLYRPHPVLDDSVVNIKIFEGEKEFNLLRYKLEENKSVVNFAKDFEIFPYQGLRDVNYVEDVLNDKSVVYANFEVTEKDKSTKSFIKGVEKNIIEEPIGFKGKLVYIKHNNHVYIWKTGILDNISQEKTFDDIIKSFKFF